MTAAVANILLLLGGTAFLGAVVAVLRRAPWWLPFALAGFALIALECALERQWAGAGWNAGWAVVLLGGDWWDRRGRKAAKTLGEKSRALLAAVVEKAREAGSPLPVPEGAGAGC